ncbi:MAG: CoA pyrophosphatase [Hyphomicrobium sp.]|nr:CoA pyrophosphatase [Hyphomicrobium sp.]
MPPQTPPAVTEAAAFERLARARLHPSDNAAADYSADHELGPSDFDLNPSTLTGSSPSTDGEPPKLFRPAAVLVGIIAHAAPTVLLTERTRHLAAHGGQIAFPGGKIEPTDPSPLAAALREANEEIGLSPAAVEPLGYLPAYRTATGFRIIPVVALIHPPIDLVAEPSEVADVFEVPLAFLMAEANHRVDHRSWQGRERRFYAMRFEQRYIWGATAGILKSLHRSLFQE